MTQYDLYTVFIIILMALFTVSGQQAVSRAYQLEKTSRVAATNYAQIALSYVWDLAIFHENL